MSYRLKMSIETGEEERGLEARAIASEVKRRKDEDLKA